MTGQEKQYYINISATINKESDAENPDRKRYIVDAYPHGRCNENGNILAPIEVEFDNYYSAFVARALVEQCGIECDLHSSY